MMEDELFRIANRNYDDVAYRKNIDEAIQIANRSYNAKHKRNDGQMDEQPVSAFDLCQEILTVMLMILAAVNLIMLAVILWQIFI